jgi:hypothetical protein
MPVPFLNLILLKVKSLLLTTTRTHSRKLFAAALGLAAFAGCTATPTENKIDSPRRDKISGKIGLSPGVSPESVYVWLEGTPLSTYTDKTGAFELALPASGRVPPFNVTASFNLYFYLANYKLYFTPVFVEDGQFLYSRGEIGREGALIGTRYLQELLKINTLVQPATLPKNYQGPISIEVSLSAAFDSVAVVLTKAAGGKLGEIFLRHTDSGKLFFGAASATTPPREVVKIGREPFKYAADFPFKLEALPAGRYQAIPYFLIMQENMPAGLLPSLGDNVDALGPGFLKIPIRRNGGQFFILASESPNR